MPIAPPFCGLSHTASVTKRVRQKLLYSFASSLGEMTAGVYANSIQRAPRASVPGCTPWCGIYAVTGVNGLFDCPRLQRTSASIT